MKMTLANTRRERHQQQNKWLISINAVLLIILLCQSINHLRQRNDTHIVLIPPVLHQTVWVSKKAVSAAYLDEMTRYFADLLLNTTPQTIEERQLLLLHYVSPQHYGDLKQQLIMERERVKHQQISTNFYLHQIQIDSKDMAAKINGQLLVRVGTKIVSQKNTYYMIHYTWEDGRLWIDGWKQNRL